MAFGRIAGARVGARNRSLAADGAAPQVDPKGGRGAFSSPERAAAYRTACRFFRGFELLPAAVLESVHGFPEAFIEGAGPLSLADRERIAHAVTGEPLAAFGGDEPTSADATAHGETSPNDAEPLGQAPLRHAALVDFVRNVLARWRPLRFEDLEPMLDVGFELQAVREAAELAIDFHVIHRLTSALTVSLPGAFAVVPRPQAPRGSQRGRVGHACRSPDEDEDQALLILPAVPEPQVRRSSDRACG